MPGSYSGRFSFKLVCLILSVITGFSFAINSFGSHKVYADGTITIDSSTAWGDRGGLRVILSGFEDGQNVDVTFTFDSEVFAGFSGDAAQILSYANGGEQVTIRFIGWNGDEGNPNGTYGLTFQEQISLTN